MSTEQKIIKNKVGLLKLAEMLGQRFHFVGEDGKWIEAKLLEEAKALRVYDAGVAVGREIERSSIQ